MELISKQRGVFLTVLILISLVGSISGLFETDFSARQVEWFKYWYYINSIMSLVLLVGIFNWKKIAATLWIALLCIYTIVDFSLIRSNLGLMERYVWLSITGIHLALWISQLMRKWQYFK